MSNLSQFKATVPVLGTGISTALAIAVGTDGAPVVKGGAGGVPTSLTLTNATGLPPAGVTGTALVAAAIGSTVQAYNINLTGINQGLATTSSPSFVNVTSNLTGNVTGNTSGTAANITGVAAIANGGTGQTTAGTALAALGGYAATNPSGYTTNTGTVTSVAALTIGTTGTNITSTVATDTTTPVITLNIPTASAANRGALSAADWSTFNGKQAAGTYATGTGTASGTNTGDNAVNSNYSSLVTNATHTGDVTGSTALTLASVITAGGPTGSASVVPVITYDAKGRLTAVTTAAITPGAIGAQVAGTYATGTGTASGTNTGDNAVNTNYSGLVTNATHTGDVTGSAALTIAAGAVTYAKMQNVSATSRVLGRVTAAAGVVEELTGANLATIIGITNTAANVTSVNGVTGAVTAANISAAATTGYGFTPYSNANPSGYTANTGTVTGVTGTAPVVSSGGTAPAISMAAATSVVNGYMTSTYAAKLDGVAAGATANTGTVTGVTGTAPVVSSGGTAPAISMAAATTSVSGYLTSTDWNTFNGKQAALGFTPYNSTNPSGFTSNTGTVTGVSGTAPVVSSGGTAPAISMAAATSAVNGYMTSTYASKLDGIAAGANNYSHPANHAPSIITQDASNRFVTDTEKSTWNGKQAAGTYATGTGTASGTNTGDETLATIKTKLGITTLSGSNTGDQTLPTTLPASDVYAWAKAASKPSYSAAEVGSDAAGTARPASDVYAWAKAATAPASGVTNSGVFVLSGNGYGSTNTTIRRYATTRINVGTDITYADSATLGASFTINATGVYFIEVSERHTAQTTWGCSVNSSELTSSIDTITAADVVVYGLLAANVPGTLAMCAYLTSGDVIRSHGAGVSTTTAPYYSNFAIRRIG